MARLNLSRWPAGLPTQRWRIVVQVEEADLIPDRLPRRGAALAGPRDAPKWLAFDCPCGTGHRLLINLDNRRRPAWRLVRTRPLTIRPSIDITQDGTRCHFIITDGKIRWAVPAHGLEGTPRRPARKARNHD
jgi:hypothetical protein